MGSYRLTRRAENDLFEIGRNDAIESVGVDWVEMADRQTAAVSEDLAWALEK